MSKSSGRTKLYLVGAVAAVSLIVSAFSGVASASLSKADPSSIPGAFGALPTAGTPAHGGVVNMAESPGNGPDYIFPITPASDETLATENSFQNFIWQPLWWYVNGDKTGIDYRDSLAKAPVFSNDNKTVTITLDPNWKWSDGTPVTSTDVAFFIDILEAAIKISPANYGNLTPGLFPSFLTSIQTPNATTIVLNLNKRYNQNFVFLDQLDLIVPLPAHAWSKTSVDGPIIDFTNPANATAIYNFLNAQSEDLSTYATNPLWQVINGPFKLKSFDPATGGTSFVANTKYSGPVKPDISGINEVAFTSTESEFNQFLSGSLTAGPVDPSDLPQVSRLKADGYTVWGYPASFFSYMPYNFKDQTGDFDNIIKQLYIRQALAHLEDEPAVIQSKGIFSGAAGPDYGPLPAIPKSPFSPPNALVNPYPYSISTATKLLVSHGWKVAPGGTTTCMKAGSSANECGAGIPKGTPLTWNLIYENSPSDVGAQDEAFASNAKEVGITINLSAKTHNYINSNLSDVSNPSNDNTWAMQDFGGWTAGIYPTTNSIFNTTGGENIGGYSDPTADKDISNSVSSLSNSAVNTEIQYLTAQQPGLFQPNADVIWAFKKNLGGSAASFEGVSQYQPNPLYWYFKKS